MKQAKQKLKKGSQKSKTALREFIVSQWDGFAGDLDHYQWPGEYARWHELVFCIIFKLGEPKINAATARSLVSALDNLSLLDIGQLSGLLKQNKRQVQWQDKSVKLLLDILQRAGFSLVLAKNVVTVICQAAASLQTKHSGKVQCYLRYYGGKMIDELNRHFSFPGLDSKRVRDIFTLWLQNVINMPVELADNSVKKLCREFDVNIEDLVSTADNLDVNVALLDDMAAEALSPNR